MKTNHLIFGYDVIMNVTSNDSSDIKYNWPVLLLLPIIIFGLAGNIVVCMAVSMEKRLQSVTNYFLLSLAITDLLVCLIVWPFSMLQEFVGYWPLGGGLCIVYITSDVLMCTSSILHLVTISLERYLAIRSPLSTRTRSKTTVKIKIASVWAVSLVISSPITILGIVNEHNIFHLQQCVLTNTDFMLYGSVMVFYIPLGVIGLSFGLTIRLLRAQWKMCDPNRYKEGEMNMRRSKSRNQMSLRERFKNHSLKNGKKRSNSCPESGKEAALKDVENSRKPDRIALKQLEPLLPLDQSKTNNIFNATDSSTSSVIDGPHSSPSISQSSSEYRMDFDYLRQRSIPIDETEEWTLTSPSRSTSKSTETSTTQLPSSSEHDDSTFSLKSQIRLSDVNENEEIPPKVTKTVSAPSRLHELVKKPHAFIKSASFNVISKKDSVKQKEAKNSVKTEQKASKTLGILFSAFVVFWAPFFIINILTALCSACHFEHMLVTIFVWLGYVSSTLNPIIYTVFNKTFRTTFIKLLKCQYRTIQKPMRIKAICVGINNLHNINVNSDVQIPL